MIFNDALPKGLPYVNGLLKKKGLQMLVQFCNLRHGVPRTVEMLDGLKNLGFTYATQVGPVDRHRRPGHPEREEGASSTRRGTK